MKPLPLVIIPQFLRETKDVMFTADAVRSIRKTEGDAVDILVIDDGSPVKALVDSVESMAPQWDFDFERKPENTGFSSTVNIGLMRCLQEGRDAILCNADVEMMGSGWLSVMRGTQNIHSKGMAGVVGAMLVYPSSGLIQHAGVYFSMLTRQFDHLFRFAPMNLPEAHQYRLCPVTAALHLIRHDVLADVGLYDEQFKMGYEDVDYCLRAMLANRECVFNPNVRAWHAESMFRGRRSPQIEQWSAQSTLHLAEKYRNQSFAGLVPFV